MKKLLVGIAIWGCTIGLAAALTIETAAPPPLIPFSGVMTTSSGGPFVGLVSAIFALYEEPEGGVPLWVDIQMVQTDAAGGYLALLGAATELPVDLFATSTALWLGVQPQGQVEQPRVRFISVPYALKAGDADTLGGRPLADFVLLSGEYGDGEGGGSARTVDSRTNESSDDLAAITSGHTGDGWTDDGSVVRLDTVTDRVGIGTTSPDNTLHVHQASAGAAASGHSSSAIVIEGDSDTSIEVITPAGNLGRIMFSDPEGVGRGRISYNHLTDTMVLQTRSSTRLAIDAGGNVGLGTTSPGTRLHVFTGSAGAVSVQSEVGLVIEDDENAYIQFLTPATNAAGIFFGDPSGNTGQLVYDHAIDGMRFQTNGSTRIFIDSAGKVGIGTTSPSEKLEIKGNIKAVDITATGNLAAKYQDVAEWVDAVGELPPGTVVTVDPTGSNRVKASEEEYDTGVLGAVSAQPGLILGDPGPNKEMVAQSGRVIVKVDATFGAIGIGDLLSTSPTPGHAMRSDPLSLGELLLHRPGTVLGKALEPWHTGRGEILVLLTLQ